MGGSECSAWCLVARNHNGALRVRECCATGGPAGPLGVGVTAQQNGARVPTRRPHPASPIAAAVAAAATATTDPSHVFAGL